MDIADGKPTQGPGGVLYPPAEPIAERAEVGPLFIKVELRDGRIICVPWSWFPRLRNGTSEQRAAVELIAGGRALHWEALDEDLSVRGLLMPSGV